MSPTVWTEREVSAVGNQTPILMLPWMPMLIPVAGNVWNERETPLATHTERTAPAPSVTERVVAAQSWTERTL